MLVLTRKNFEAVVVGHPTGRLEEMLTVTVLGIAKDKVRLGFEVAGNTPVHRREVWHRIRAASQMPPAQTTSQ